MFNQLRMFFYIFLPPFVLSRCRQSLLIFSSWMCVSLYHRKMENKLKIDCDDRRRRQRYSFVFFLVGFVTTFRRQKIFRKREGPFFFFFFFLAGWLLSDILLVLLCVNAPKKIIIKNKSRNKTKDDTQRCRLSSAHRCSRSPLFFFFRYLERALLEFFEMTFVKNNIRIYFLILLTRGP